MAEPFKPTLARNLLIVAAFFSVLAVACAVVVLQRVGAAMTAIESKEARGK